MLLCMEHFEEQVLLNCSITRIRGESEPMRKEGRDLVVMSVQEKREVENWLWNVTL